VRAFKAENEECGTVELRDCATHASGPVTWAYEYNHLHVDKNCLQYDPEADKVQVCRCDGKQTQVWKLANGQVRDGEEQALCLSVMDNNVITMTSCEFLSAASEWIFEETDGEPQTLDEEDDEDAGEEEEHENEEIDSEMRDKVKEVRPSHFFLLFFRFSPLAT